MEDQVSKFEFAKWRLKMGLTQQQAAERLGYAHRSSINHLETGRRQITPRIKMICDMLQKEQENDGKNQR